MPDKLYRSHSIDFSEKGASGNLTLWEDSPVSPFNVGDTFYPIINGPALTVDKVSIKDNVIAEVAGKTVRQWEISIEGSNFDDALHQADQTRVKYNFTISDEGKSGTMDVTNMGDNPAISLDIGDSFSVPGIGEVTCVKVSGNDSYDDDRHSWTVTYEGSDHPEQQDASLETKYNFSIDENGHSGSMSITVEGDNPVLDLQVGDVFSLPGIGNVTCSKISGNDDGSHLWYITYEGSISQNDEAAEPFPQIKYSFSIDHDAHSGSMSVVNEGDAPALNIDVGDDFSIPGIGIVTCSKVSGHDEYTDSGSHRWNITYEGTNAQNSEDEEALPETKYSLTIEKDNDGDIQKSGSMSVVNEGNAPVFDVCVGSQFNIPGIGNITCTKVSANDDYSKAGTHRWAVTYEGIIAGDSAHDDQPDEPQENNAKYSFSIDDDAMSGSVEITATGNSPAFAHEVGDIINLPGIGNVTCTKISGSDSYSDSGKRKWTVVYEASNDLSHKEQQNSTIKYSLSIENNSDGLTIYSGSKEFSCSGNAPVPDINIGDTFSLPLIGNVTCTKIHSSNDKPDSWTVTIEGSRGGNEAGGDDDQQELPENETTISYEINGSTVRSVSGQFIALRRSQYPITKKNIVIYSDAATPVTLPGETYEGGIVTSENIVKETIKNNGVVTAQYYKHSIEVEA